MDGRVDEPSFSGGSAGRTVPARREPAAEPEGGGRGFP